MTRSICYKCGCDTSTKEKLMFTTPSDYKGVKIMKCVNVEKLKTLLLQENVEIMFDDGKLLINKTCVDRLRKWFDSTEPPKHVHILNYYIDGTGVNVIDTIDNQSTELVKAARSIQRNRERDGPTNISSAKHETNPDNDNHRSRLVSIDAAQHKRDESKYAQNRTNTIDGWKNYGSTRRP